MLKTFRNHLRQARWCLPIVLMGLLFGPDTRLSAKPIPPLMKTLLGVFPERGGWFVEGPLGTPPGIPERARPYFEQPRVIVPDIDALQGAVGRLFAASSILPVRRIRRYDEKPGAKGLPGFRGVWCEMEDKEAVGFAILTPNQNRFLIWARDQYYRACAVDSIPSKVRDWYARSVSEYLASRDYQVPDNSPPRSADRDLPSWMDLYPDAPIPAVKDKSKRREFEAAHREIKTWGWQGLVAFVPTTETIHRFIDEAPDTLYPDRTGNLLQHRYRALLNTGNGTTSINTLTRAAFDTFTSGRYIFAVDEFQRVRIAIVSETDDPSTTGVGCAMIFPGAGIRTAGWMELDRRGNRIILQRIAPNSPSHFYPNILPSFRIDVTIRSDEYLLTLGHLFRSFQTMGIPFDGVLIQKF